MQLLNFIQLFSMIVPVALRATMQRHFGGYHYKLLARETIQIMKVFMDKDHQYGAVIKILAACSNRNARHTAPKIIFERLVRAVCGYTNSMHLGPNNLFRKSAITVFFSFFFNVSRAKVM